MADLISEKGLKNSIPVAEIATAVITLSNGKRIEVTNPVMQIVELFRFVENPFKGDVQVEKQKMNELELRDGQIYLDGNLLKGVEKFKLKSTAENNCAELFVKLLVELP